MSLPCPGLTELGQQVLDALPAYPATGARARDVAARLGRSAWEVREVLLGFQNADLAYQAGGWWWKRVR